MDGSGYFVNSENVQIIGCSFQTTGAEPLRFANNNVAFPHGWGHWRAALWRRENDCPGAGWARERGFSECGPPTIPGLVTAFLLNAWFGKP